MSQTNLKSNLTKNPDKSFTLTVTIPQAEIIKANSEVVAHLASHLEINGFRKGSVPIDVAKNHLNAQSVLEETFQKVIPPIYLDLIQEHKLRPIMDPKAKLLNPPMTLDKDWEFEFLGSERPEVNLDKDWLEKVKKLPKPTNTDEVVKLLQSLSSVKLSPVLMEADVQNKLSQLVEQTLQAGTTVEKHLEALKMKLEDYVKKLEKQIEDEWALNLAIDQIATSQNITVTPEETQEAIKKTNQPNLNPAVISYILRQQKTIDYLLTLV